MHHRSVQNSGVSGVLAAASTGLHAVAVAALLVAGAAIFARAFLGAAPLTPNGALDHGIDEINSVVVRVVHISLLGVAADDTLPLSSTGLPCRTTEV